MTGPAHASPARKGARIKLLRMRNTSLLAYVAAVALPLSQAACSFVFVETPRPREGVTRCTRSTGAPVVDTLVAVPALAIGAIAGMKYLSDLGGAPGDDGHDVAGSVAAVSLPVGVLYSLGAIYGFRETARCRATPTPSAGGE